VEGSTPSETNKKPAHTGGAGNVEAPPPPTTTTTERINWALSGDSRGERTYGGNGGCGW
jgi:hypothetical protein